MFPNNKYYPLYRYLKTCEQHELKMSFAEIEAVLDAPLPASARTKRAWWSNRKVGGVQSSAWMLNEYQIVEIDLGVGYVVFRKPGLVYEVEQIGDTIVWNANLIKALRHHMGVSQSELADQLGMRQQTISEWETGSYTPRRSTSKFLTMVAEQVGFVEYLGDLLE